MKLSKEIAEDFLDLDDPEYFDIYIYKYTEIEDAAAESLAKYQGNLDLNGLTELSDAAAESLAKHQGDLHLPNRLF